LVFSCSPGHCVLVALVLGFYYTHTTEVRALEAQLSALKSSTPAVFAPATPAPIAAAATAAPANAAQTGSTPTKAVPSKPAEGRREGWNRAKTPVAGKETDDNVPPEMRKGGGSPSASSDPHSRTKKRRRGRLSSLTSTPSSTMFRRLNLSATSWLVRPLRSPSPSLKRPPAPALLSIVRLECKCVQRTRTPSPCTSCLKHNNIGSAATLRAL